MDGPTPYRDGKPLADIIPPDHRRAKIMALVVASMVVGVLMWQLASYGVGLLAGRGQDDPLTAPTTPGYVAGRINPTVLHGPGGDVSLPAPMRSVVHIWLQGCADCMPAFEAMRSLEADGGYFISAPVINVSYGQADPTWAASYGVRENLVYDVGGASMIKPLGIATFTTLVVDSDGVILHRDRPNRPGYRDRVRHALGPGSALPIGGRDRPMGPRADAPPDGPFDGEALQRVVAGHRAEIRARCWDDPWNAEVASANVTVSVTVITDGSAAKVVSSGNNPRLAACIEREVKAWRFPRPKDTTTANIPFKFVRE